jgi:hypothetical protein
MLHSVANVTALLVLAASQSAGPRAATSVQAPASQRIDVSIIQLIATPERFDGKPIRVIGFLHLEFEGNALYLHESDFCHRITSNAIWVGVGSPPKDEQAALNNAYVLLEGVFSAQSKGHMGMFAGSVQRVTRLSGVNIDAEPRRCDPRLTTPR